MHRRAFLATGLAALATLRSGGALSRGKLQTAGPPPVSENATAVFVRKQAAELSRRIFEPPPETFPGALAAMGYDEYRDLRFRPERAVWRGEDLGFELQFFVSAYIYRTPVEIFLVENDAIRQVAADRALFEFGPQESKVPLHAPLGFSGFRIHAPLKRPNYYDELLAFQGASYFRGLGKAHSYGLSARALALNTEGPEPEEFPLFRSFWIERPKDRHSITVHALLDSPSVTGAYTFAIEPGAETVMDVDVHLFPRRDVSKVGFAPMSSMFLKDTHDSDGPLDFRPAIHDSDGFAAWNARDERLWRPLVNPPQLQLSCFRDNNPKASGSFSAEEDSTTIRISKRTITSARAPGSLPKATGERAARSSLKFQPGPSTSTTSSPSGGQTLHSLRGRRARLGTGSLGAMTFLSGTVIEWARLA